MAATFNIYNSFKVNMANGTIDVDTDVFRVLLYQTLSGVSDATLSSKGSLNASEVTEANGYSSSGKTLSNVSYALSGSNAKFDADDVFWSATGSITSMKAFVILVSGGNELVGWGQISTTSVSLTNTNRITLQWAATGLYTVS